MLKQRYVSPNASSGSNVSKSDQRFQIVALTPPGLPDPSIAIAAIRAGGIGILDLEYTRDIQIATGAIDRMIYWAKDNCGIKLNSHDDHFNAAIISKIPDEIDTIIFTPGELNNLSKYITLLKDRKRRLVFEVISTDQAKLGQQLGIDWILVKGNESSGFIGEKTSFILLQQILLETSLPTLVQGGIGLHTASACYAAGAAGIVLDSQLFLSQESPLSDDVKTHIGRMTGSETLCVGNYIGFPCRLYARSGHSVVASLIDRERLLEKDFNTHTRGNILAQWHEAIQNRVIWNSASDSLWPLGQDVAFTAQLAKQYKTVGSILQAIRRSIKDHIQTTKLSSPLNKGSLLAVSHRTIYPIVQGPMARISDNAAFAAKIAEEGALPFIAISTLKGTEVKKILEKVHTMMDGKSWGVGLLGFIENNLLKEQLEAIYPFNPPFAIVSGGLPSLIKMLESKGTFTYAHTPSPDILELFIECGVRKFIFEGNECGGHIGPRSSFVLWEVMIEKLLEKFVDGYEPEKFHILFAGGIHDSISAAMVSTLSAPLVSRGVLVGVLMGTAYLFTEEIVQEGGIVRGFQEEAICCSHTKVIETGPGHAIRCSITPFVNTFENEKRRLQFEKIPPEKIRNKLEELIVGRLRVAAKGVFRNPSDGLNPNEPCLIPANNKEQYAEGIYMIGQLAALRDKTFTIKDLHYDVAVKSSDRVRSLSFIEDNMQTKYADEIAIIGMACMFPKAMNLQTYWENILDKVNAISEIPPHRWDWRLYFNEDVKARDKIYSKWGGFLDDIAFDPLKYGIPPSVLSSIEPLHLMTLDVVNAALQNAGYKDKNFPREKTSVIFGTGGGIGELGQNYIFRSALPQHLGDYSDEILKHLPVWTEDSFPGILMNVLAGRVANYFDLGGINYTIDAACASSLAALYDGVKELQSGNSDMVIAGGVDACQNPFTFLCFSKTHALSPHGKCLVFDEKADGTVISEGLGIIILKRLSDAERDGDRIYAVIKSVAGSSDGRGKCMTAPRHEGQMLALKRAYEKAGFSAATIELLEAHGTGTTVGDQVESQSAAQLLIESKAANQNCAIGSVKSMIGHTKGAAGMAGLVKIALSLYHKVLPPTIGINKPNPKTDFLKGPLYLNTELRPWMKVNSYPRRAGVSAFGFGGTNFHAVLEEYTGDFIENKPAIRNRWTNELFLWAAPSRNNLISALESIQRTLREGTNPSLGDTAFTLYNTFKDQTESGNNPSSRLAIVASSLNDLKEKLTFVLHSMGVDGCESILDTRGIYFTETSLIKPGKIAFLFPGQGSQYINMLRELTILFPEIRSSFECADSVLKEKFSERLSSYIFPPPRFSLEGEKEQMRRLSQTNVAQPAMGAACYGMFKLYQSMDIHPDMVAGHSYGEYVALCAAGVFDEKTLYDISETRGRLIIEASNEKDMGTMAAVKIGAKELWDILKDIENVGIANINAPKQTVISGKRDVVAKVVELLKSKGIDVYDIPVACAFHSKSITPAKEGFSHFLKKINFASPKTLVFSNTFAAPYGKTQEEIESCLSEHMVRPVEFVREIEAMYESGARVFVEVGPGSVLTNLIKQILDERPFLATATDMRENSALGQLLKTVGQLAINGATVSLDRLYKGRSLKNLDFNALEREMKDNFSPTTWFINGTGIRLASQIKDKQALHSKPAEKKDVVNKHEFAVEQKKDISVTPLKNQLSSPDPTPQSSNRPLTTSQQSNVHKTLGFISSNISADSTDIVMLQYQQLINRFLETQKSIMLTYLQGTSQNLPTGQVNEQILPQKENVVSSKEYANIPPSENKGTESTASQISSKRSGFNKEGIKAELLRITSERTGYPVEMLGLDSDIEADLGIDSIKRVEILSAFAKFFPASEQQKIHGIMEDISRLKTFRMVLDRSAEVLVIADKKPANTSSSGNKEIENTVNKISSKWSGCADVIVPRFLLEPLITPYPSENLEIINNKLFIITDDGHGAADILVQDIKKHKGQAIIIRMSTVQTKMDDQNYSVDLADYKKISTAVEEIRQKYGPIAGIVHLLPLERTIAFKEMDIKTWRNLIKRELKSLFFLAKILGHDLRDAGRSGGGWLVAAMTLNKHFNGASNRGDYFVGRAGIAGLLKTVAFEWPEVNCKAINLDITNTPSILSSQVLREICSKNNTVEVGYRGLDRLIYKAKSAPLNKVATEGIQINKDWVILVTGGAIGITAEVACELAVKYQPTLLLVGRSPFPNDSEFSDIPDISSPKEVKAALIEKLRTNEGYSVTPSRVEAAYLRHLRNREMRQNVEKMQNAGATVCYFQADVRDEQKFGELIDEVYHSYGHLDGIIHGAGIIEDKLLEDKSLESFDRVLDTKIDSAFILSKKVRVESLKFIAFFTSVAGCFGNKGQSDYAAANEIVNELALYLDRQWKCRILAVNWGPWKKVGMVTPEVERQFKERGVQLIPPADGSRMFEEEIRYGSKGDVEVVIGDGPWI